MKFRLILILDLIVACNTISIDKEIKGGGLENMLIEPASLVFQTTWSAVAHDKDLEKLGEINIIDLGNNIRSIQQCSICSNSEKKFLANVINNPQLSLDKITKYFPDLLAEYLPEQKFVSKRQLLNRMLLKAVKNNDIELTKLTVNMGASVDWAEEGKSPLLILAVENNYPEIINILLSKGANINVTDRSGDTPLIVAVKKRNKNLVNLLLSQGANINAKNYIGNTSLMLAAQIRDSQDIAAILIDNNADVNLTNKFGNTALILAVASNNKKLVKMLLKADADPNIKNKDGKTALMKALKGKQKAIAKILIKAGANVNTKDKSKKNP